MRNPYIRYERESSIFRGGSLFQRARELLARRETAKFADIPRFRREDNDARGKYEGVALRTAGTTWLAAFLGFPTRGEPAQMRVRNP